LPAALGADRCGVVRGAGRILVLIVSLASVAVRAVPDRVPAGHLPVNERAGLGFSRGSPWALVLRTIVLDVRPDRRG
jgi:hypothetical protein